MSDSYMLPRPAAWVLMVSVLLIAPVGFYLLAYFGAQPALVRFIEVAKHGRAAARPVLSHATVLMLARVAAFLGVVFDITVVRRIGEG